MWKQVVAGFGAAVMLASGGALAVVSWFNKKSSRPKLPTHWTSDLWNEVAGPPSSSEEFDLQ